MQGEIKDILRQAKIIELLIRNKSEYLEHFDKLTGNQTLKDGLLFDSLSGYRNDILLQIRRLVELRATIQRAFGNVHDSTQQIILERRYISGRSFDEISAETGLSRSYVLRLHRHALEAISDADKENILRVAKAI